MRRVHEATLVLGIALLFAVLFRHTLHLHRAPHLYFTVVAALFVVSTASALLLALRSHQTPLPSRTVATYFFATAGVAFMVMAGINDLWIPLSYPARFAIALVVLCILFVVPWVVSEFRAVHRSPIAFDAALVPFLALALFQLTASQIHLDMFWDQEFWLLFGLPAFLITYIAMRLVVRRGWSTVLPLCTSTAILYVIIGGTFGSFIRN